ncbi:MAG: hypothetical protein H0W86_08435 [Armatimonadetes bacterium]|nr:hypothetical protein [Armatimonadota bacterium]
MLDAVEGLVTGDTVIHLHGAFVSAMLLDRLLTQWTDVNLVGCALAKNWWRTPKRPRQCRTLWLQNCTACQPPNLVIGCSSWPELNWLSVDEGYWDPDLNKGAIPPEESLSHTSSFPASTSHILNAFHSSNLESLFVYNCKDISFLRHLPASKRIRDIYLDGSPYSEEIFDWITSQKGLQQFSISWKPDTPIPWERLSRLPKLRSLDVTGTSFSDEDLAEVAKYTRLSVIHAFYTELTPASWPLVFAMPALKQVLVSTEMLHGPIPSGLPQDTLLEEVVALNVSAKHMEYLQRLLEPYPTVKSFEM